MRILTALGALALPALLAPAAALAQPRAGGCTAGPAEPSGSELLRPTQIAICAYEPAEFHARLMRLMAVREGRLGVEAVERTFGLPRLVTTYDSVREANYGIVLRSAPGRAPWSAAISVNESYGPNFEGRPARFRGDPLRPARINPRARGDIRIDVSLLGSGGPLIAANPFCLQVDRFGDRAVRLGWRLSTVSRFSFHGPPMPALDMVRGALSFSTDLTSAARCLERFQLSQAASPPIPEPTEAELAAHRRDFARRMADQVEQNALRFAVQGPEQEEARRAWARLLRDMTYANEAGEAIDVAPAIKAMPVEQLRLLARRLVVGDFWGRWSGDCIDGVRAGDVRAAFARLAPGRGWSALDIQAMTTLCSIYVQGRLYRSTPPPP